MAAFFQQLTAQEVVDDDCSRPYPFCLAYQLDHDVTPWGTGTTGWWNGKGARSGAPATPRPVLAPGRRLSAPHRRSSSGGARHGCVVTKTGRMPMGAATRRLRLALVRARASHHALADSTRIANATNLCRLTEYGTSFLYDIVLERLMQHFEDGPSALRPRIQKENAVVCPRRLPRQRGLRQGHRRQDGGEPARPHRLPGSGGPEQQDVGVRTPALPAALHQHLR